MNNKDRIIIKIYGSRVVESYCRTLHNDYDELKSQLIYQLIKMPEAKMVTAEDKGYLEYMCFVICKRIVGGRVKDSGIFNIFKGGSRNNLSIEEGWGFDKEDEVGDDDYSNKKIDRVKEIVDEMHWYSKTLFNYFYNDGYKLREIAEMTGINIKSVAYDIKKTREYIKKKIKDDRNTP
jgi:hypothetical protein